MHLPTAICSNKSHHRPAQCLTCSMHAGMGMMPTAAQKYAASAGLIPAYNPAAMSQCASAPLLAW